MAAESELEGSDAGAGDEASRRAHRRVAVQLRVAVVLGRDTAYLATTENMSEGGMLIRDYNGPHLKSGRLVGLNVRGVVSDTAEEDSQQYLMRVVRHAENFLALRFVDEEE